MPALALLFLRRGVFVGKRLHGRPALRVHAIHVAGRARRRQAAAGPVRHAHFGLFRLRVRAHDARQVNEVAVRAAQDPLLALPLHQRFRLGVHVPIAHEAHRLARARVRRDGCLPHDAGGCFGLNIHPEFLPLGQDVLLAEEAFVPEALLARGVEEDLRRDQLDLVRLAGLRVLPHINELHVHPASILRLEVLQDRGHHLAGNALVRAQVHQFRQLGRLRRPGRPTRYQRWLPARF